MNVERILKLAEIILLPETYFNMDFYFTTCGTPSCMAGHAIAAWKTDENRRDCRRSTSDRAANILELDADFAKETLFQPLKFEDLKHITKEQAADALRVVATGETDFFKIWKLALVQGVRIEDDETEAHEIGA